MGKTITLYLTDEELKLINQICETQGCNTHSVVKAGLQLFLCEATKDKLLLQEKAQVARSRPKKIDQNQSTEIIGSKGGE